MKSCNEIRSNIHVFGHSRSTYWSLAPFGHWFLSVDTEKVHSENRPSQRDPFRQRHQLFKRWDRALWIHKRLETRENPRKPVAKKYQVVLQSPLWLALRKYLGAMYSYDSKDTSSERHYRRRRPGYFTARGGEHYEWKSKSRQSLVTPKIKSLWRPTICCFCVRNHQCHQGCLEERISCHAADGDKCNVWQISSVKDGQRSTCRYFKAENNGYDHG